MSQFPIADMVQTMLDVGASSEAIIVAIRAMETPKPVSAAALRMRKTRARRAQQSATRSQLLHPSENAPNQSEDVAQHVAHNVVKLHSNQSDTRTRRRNSVAPRQNAHIEDSTNVSEVGSSNTSESESKKKIRGTRLPEGWRPADPQWTLDQISREEARRQIERFHDYWKGATGSKGRKADWEATWRNWVRTYVERRDPIQTKQQQSRVII